MKRLIASVVCPSIPMLQDAGYSSSFMNDRSEIQLADFSSYVKIGKDKWECHSPNNHVLSNSVTSEQLYDILQNKNIIKVNLV